MAAASIPRTISGSSICSAAPGPRTGRDKASASPTSAPWYGGLGEPCRSPQNFTKAARSRSRCPSIGHPVTGTYGHEYSSHYHHDQDDEGHARLIERNIRRSGVNNEIIPFTNGAAALNYLFGKDGTGLEHKGSALLILLDLNLPDTSGIDILKRVKENTHLKTTPVVVLTTTDDSHEIKRCYELGCNVYITKPVNYESFANAIRQLGLFFSVIQVPPAAT